MAKVILAFLLFCAVGGCTPFRPVVENIPDDSYNVTPKLRLALIQMIDSSDFYVPWHIDQELTSDLRYQLMCNGQLMVLPEEELYISATNLQSSDLFSTDLSFTQKFCDTDFLIALELLQHEIVPFSSEKISPCFPAQGLRCSSMLQMNLRLRIIDLTCEVPKVILQEVLSSNLIIPKEGENLDYEKHRWGTDTFSSTPLGQAHHRMICDLAARIENALKP